VEPLGAGTRGAFVQAIPGTRTLSFDLNFSSLALRMDGVTYAQSDWLDFDWARNDVASPKIEFVLDDELRTGRRFPGLTETEGIRFQFGASILTRRAR